MDDKDLKKEKIKKLYNMKDEYFNIFKKYKKMYSKLNRLNTALSVFTSVSGATSISLIISGLTFPPLLIASAGLQGFGFLLSTAQAKMQLQNKIESYRNTFLSYSNIVKEISIVLLKNNLSSQEYTVYIEEIESKIQMIESNQIF